jgi:nondiscriminating aspartyl-tRNA synthetase
MKRIMISELKKFIGKEVKISGFLHELRNQSKVKFLLIRDISGIIQCVALPEFKLFEEISRIPKESVIEIVGLVKDEEQAPSGVEIEIKSYSILSTASLDLPILVVEKSNEAALPLRLDYRWIDLRKQRNSLIFKIWTTMESAMREYCLLKGCIQIHTPKMIGTPSEGGAEVFSLDYFGKKAYLAQSPQFYKQMAMASGLEKVFEVGPVFRADTSHTVRHLTEFTGFDVELSFIESEEELMVFEEEMISYSISKIKEIHGDDIKRIFGFELVVPSLPFPRLTMQECSKILKEKGLVEVDELSLEGEKKIGEFIKNSYSHDFVFVTGYSYSRRPFYHMKTGSNSTKSFELLHLGVEITTGAQREHRYKILKDQALEKGLSLEPLKDYLDFFKYGCPPHGGFGIGVSRVLMQILMLSNVREATFLPRDTQRLTP